MTTADLLLGKHVDYPEQYAPEVLCGVPRSLGRDAIGITTLPFTGVDVWNAYEVSWLNLNGKPEVAVAEIFVPCESANLIESKSLKLYFNSFNLTRISGKDELIELAEKDLSACAQAPVTVRLISPQDWHAQTLKCAEGDVIDDLPITVGDIAAPDSQYLKSLGNEVIEESITSHLLRSCCPVTGQPDWATVIIQYKGYAIERENLLRYIIGFRQQREFHEQCVERIFCDIWSQLKPEKLMVQARYTRRGGLDINPVRSSYPIIADNARWFRQ